MGGGGGTLATDSCEVSKTSPFDSLPESTKEKCLAILKAQEKRQARRFRVRSRNIIRSSYSGGSSDSGVSNAVVFGGALLAGHMASEHGTCGCDFDSNDSVDCDCSGCGE